MKSTRKRTRPGQRRGARCRHHCNNTIGRTRKDTDPNAPKVNAAAAAPKQNQIDPATCFFKYCAAQAAAPRRRPSNPEGIGYRAGLLHAKRMPCEQNFNRLSSKSLENAAAPKPHDEKDKAQYASRSNDSGWTPLQQIQTGAFLTCSNAMATPSPNR